MAGDPAFSRRVVVGLGGAERRRAQGGHLQFTAYACTTAAIQPLTKYVATQYGAEGIRCNTVAPGLIATEPLREGMPKPLQDAVVANKLVGRLGEPRDIAEAVRFLASDRSAFITGEIVAVDGGLRAGPEPRLGAARARHPGRLTLGISRSPGYISRRGSASAHRRSAAR